MTHGMWVICMNFFLGNYGKVDKLGNLTTCCYYSDSKTHPQYFTIMYVPERPHTPKRKITSPNTRNSRRLYRGHLFI